MRSIGIGGLIALLMIGGVVAALLTSRGETPKEQTNSTKPIPVKATTPPPVSSGTAGALTRVQVTAGIRRVRGAVKVCGLQKEQNSALTLTATITVAPNGSVSQVSTTPAGELADCVHAALKEARFAPTKRGRTFQYPFLFR